MQRRTRKVDSAHPEKSPTAVANHLGPPARLSSVVLNIAEGNARRGKDKLNRLSFAEGSAREAMEEIITAVEWGYVKREQGDPVIALFDRVIAMLVRVRFPRPKPLTGEIR